MKLLIIEDSQAISNAYVKVLAAAGHKVECTANPLVGISKILRSSYDLLLVDLMLPEIHGAEFIARVRAEGVSTPIVVLTNMGSGFDKDKLHELGIRDILLKSKIGPSELRELVHTYQPK